MPGYQTSFNWYNSEKLGKGGLFLRIDNANKVCRSETVLQYIDELYETSKRNNCSKDEIRKFVKDKIVGKIVVAQYGNNRWSFLN